jgi:membrane-bound lytic murein transglycosylase D
MKPWLLEIARLYLETGVLLAVAGLLAALLLRLSGPAVSRLRITQLLLFCALLLPAGMALLPTRTLLPPKAQVWSGSMKSEGGGYALLASVHTDPAPPPVLQGWKFSDRTLGLLAALLALGTLLGAVRIARHYLALGAFLLRQKPRLALGRVRVVETHECAVAFSARFGGLAYVALPSYLPRNEARMTLAHELQHHRQGDTRFVFLVESIKALFFWNPASYRLARLVDEIQEFACDEALIGRRRFSARAYGRCLLRAAETALGSGRPLVGTTGMATTGSGQLLKRRITMILNPIRPKGRLFPSLAIGTVIVMAAVSFAAHSAVQSRGLSKEQAIAAAQSAALGSGVPVDMNDFVHASLIRYTSTPEGRKHLKGAFERLPKYEAMIQRKITEYGLPAELIAMPMFESGFRNDVVSSMKAAGIWQFIPQTAVRYKLKVEPGNDQRTNEEMETDAAMRYLTDLHTQFKDWRLAIKAYNEGEHRVEELIKKNGTRDPWVLEKASSTEGYLAGAIATVILYRNPKLLD